MPSTYTQNLGVELPATGEQANIWGQTVNRNMATMDAAIGGSIGITMSDAAYLLQTDNAASTPPQGVHPFIAWGGSQTQQRTVTISPATNQHIYIMSNRTSGGFPIAFQQGSGTQVILQNGYDAIIYCDGNAPGSNVAVALNNPQFNNVLVQGLLQVNGNVAGNLLLANSLGVGGAASVPDALTVNGLGTGGMGQLRLVEGSYGAIFRNDGASLYLLISTPGNPYGPWGPEAFIVDLATGVMGIGVSPSTSYNLNTGSFHAVSVVVDGAQSVGGALHVVGGLEVTSGRSYFNSGDLYQIGLYYGWGGPLAYLGTNASSQFVVSNSSGSPLLIVDASGNADIVSGLTVGAALQVGGAITAGGLIHSGSGGFQFPDGTVQATAAVTAPAYAPTPHFVSRVTNTTYTNNYGVLLTVGVVIYLPAGYGAQAQIGLGNTNNIVAAGNNTGTGTAWASMFFMVPPGWSYQIWYSGGAGFAVNYTTEYY